MMIKTLKIKLKPNNKQKTKMFQFAGAKRFAYNWALSKEQENYKKKGLRQLLKLITQNKVEKVVVLYKDRLLRFGFELIEYIASLYNCEIEIIDTTKKSEQQELVEDLVQIITVFSCKLQGKRANKARKMVKELIEEGEDDDKDIKD